MQQISDYELELMKAVWSNGGRALYAEIVSTLENKGISLTKNTIITLSSRLIAKGFLTTSKIGRRNQYRAMVSEKDYQASQAQTFIDRVYEGSAKGLVSTLIQGAFITPEEYAELKKYWEDGTDEHE